MAKSKKTKTVETETTQETKFDLKIITKAFDEIIKKHGEEGMIDLTGGKGRVERYPIDSFALAEVIGNGVPKGRLLEFYGPEQSGKSSLAVWIAAMIQKLSNGFVIFLDAEYSFDPVFAQKLGLDISPEKFQLIQPNTLEQCFEIIEKLAETKQVAYMILDSTNAAKTETEQNSNYGDANMGNQAKVYSQSFKKVVGVLSKSKMTMCFISQERGTMDKYHPIAVGVGNALKFYSSIRLEIKRIGGDDGWIFNDKGDKVGMRVKIVNKKNKTYFPYKESIMSFYFDRGFDLRDEVIEYGIKYELIERNGAYYKVPGFEKNIQGKFAVIELLNKPENKEIYNSIKKQLTDKIFNEIREEQMKYSSLPEEEKDALNEKEETIVE